MMKKKSHNYILSNLNNIKEVKYLKVKK